MKKYLFFIPLILFSMWNVQNIEAQAPFSENFESATLGQFTSTYFDVINNNGSWRAGKNPYTNSANDVMEMTNSVDIQGKTNVKLNFSISYDIENCCDNLYVELSTDGGATYPYQIADLKGNNGGYNTLSYDISSYNTSSTVKVRFRLVSDGSVTGSFFIDDVSITTNEGLTVTDIVPPTIASCSATSDSVVIDLNNNTSITLTSFSVNLDITAPDGSKITKSVSSSGNLAPGASTSLTINSMDFTQKGDYSLVATPVSSEVSVKERTETYTTALATPATETFSSNPASTWNMGNGFSWNSGWQRIERNLTNADDTLMSPFYVVNDSDIYFGYKINPYNLYSGDTVYVQLVEKCTGTITNIDTITSATTGSYNYYTNAYQTAYNMNSYLNKAVAVRYVFKSHSGNTAYFYLYEMNFKAGNDIKLEDILTSSFSNCGSNAYPLKVVVFNNGQITQSKISVSLRIYGQMDTTITRSSSNSIQYGQTDTLDFGTIDTRNAGLYQFVANVTIPKDNDMSNNDRTENYTITTPIQTPISISNNFGSFNWYQNKFGNFGSYLRSNTIYTNNTASITSFRIDSIPENTYFTFDYKISSWDASWNPVDSLSSKDIIKVYAAEDFNGTYTELYHIDEAGDKYTGGNYITIPSIDLAAYQGKDIVVKIEIQNGATADQTDAVQLYVDNFYVGAADVQVSDIIYTADAMCGDSTMAVSLDISNNTSVNAVNVPVYFEFTPVNGTEVKDSVTVSSVPANTTVRVTLPNTFDAGAPGTYRLSAYTKYTNDTNTGNDLRNESFTINAIETLPYRPFTDNTFGNWSTTNTTGTVATNWLNSGESSEMSSPKIGTIVQGTKLSFKYKLANAVGGYYLYDGDTVNVYFSDDCATTWTNIYSITHSNSQNTNAWQYVSNLDLSAYAGKDIRLKFEVLKNDSIGSIQVSFDDIEVQASGDAKAIAAKFPQYQSNVAVCGSAVDSVMVIVQNNGVSNIDTIPVELGVMFGSTTADTVKLTGAVYNLAAGDKDTLYISGFNNTQAGTYYVYAKTTLTDDLDATNDKFGNTTLTVQNLHALPWDYDGSSLPSDWQYQKHSNTTGTYIYTDALNDGDSAYFVPQKFGTIQKGDSLRLGYQTYNYDENGNWLNYNLQAGDSIIIQIAEECTGNYSNLAVITGYTTTSTSFIDTVWSLDNYIGKNIVMRVLTIKGSGIGKIQTAFDYFKITIPQPDVQFAGLYVNDGKDNDVCGNTTDPVYAIISNQSTYDAISNFEITVYVKDANANGNTLDTLSKTYTATLNQGKSDTVLVGSFNSETPETYSIEGELTLAGDINSNNDTKATSYKIWDSFDAMNYSQNFDNTDGWHFTQKTFWGWSGSSWAIQAGSLAANDTAIFYSPKLKAIQAGYSLQFDYMFTGDFLVGDKIEVYVSDNCGAGYALLGTISNPDNLSGFASANVTTEMSLANYMSKDVLFKFVVSNINGNAFTAYIDNVKIIRTDIAVIGIVNNLGDFEYTNNLASFNPSASSKGIVRYETCGKAAEDLYAVVENAGDNKLSNYDLTLTLSGNYDTTITVNATQALESGKRALVKLYTISTQTAGLIDMKLAVNTTNDGNSANDTIGFSVTTQKVYDTPFAAFNSGEFNETYYWKYDFDTIALTTHMHFTGTTLYTDNLTEGQQAYATTPKLNIPDNGGLEFSYSIQNSIEGHIIHDEAIEVQVSTNCSPTWTTLMRVDVNTNDTARNDVQFVDLSAYTGQEVRIKFLATKGHSNGTFYAQFSGIYVDSYPKAKIVLEADGEKMNGSQFAFCSDTTVTLNLDKKGYIMNWYQINLKDSTKTNLAGLNTLPDGNSYKVFCSYYKHNYTANSDTIIVTLKAKPYKPIVPMGADAVVSDVEAQYTINPVANATAYVWSLSIGGNIVGNDTSAIVYWTNAYRGTSEITVQAQNECGVSAASSPLVVRVEYLGTGIVQANDFSWSVYPNPATDQFNIDFGSTDLMGSTMNIYDAAGKRVLSRKIDAVKMNINLSGQAKGIFQIIVVDNNKLYRTNVMIK